MNDYQGYTTTDCQGNLPFGGRQHQNTPPKKTRSGRRVFALVLVGALLGSALGGGAAALYMESRINALSESAEAYTDQAASETNASAQIGTKQGSSVQQTSLNVTNLDYSTAVQNVAQTMMPSVVGVRTIENVMGFRQSAEVEGVGTGVIVSSNGLILTNQHVVSSNPKSITVTLMDGSEYNASVLYANEDMDLAVIKIDATGLQAASLGDSDDVSVGEVAIAIGNPLGLEYERSVTAGIVSALNRSILLSRTQIAENLIQTDAAINSGNSGGPLLNISGEVIGINTYKLSDGEGMGFAIPINAAKPIIEQIINTGTFSQAQLGVSVIDSELLSYYDSANLTIDHGVYISDIDTSSDAYAKGLRTGDIITKVDGIEVNTILEFRTRLYSHVPEDTVGITVERGGETFDLSVTLSAAK